MIDDLLRPLTDRDSSVALLAVVASLAVELQPALLRRLRRRLVPEASPLTEALLWSSELAGSRTTSTLLLADDVQVELRRRLASDQRLLDAARAVIVEAHAGVAEVLRCEEDLVYYGLVDLARLPRADLDQATLDNRIRDRLEQVLGSIVADPARRQYLLAWSTRAFPGLPERVQTHEAGGLLARYIASERVGAVLAPSDHDAAIGVRWTAAGLVLSARDRAPTILRVPPIQPLLVEVTLESDGQWSEPRRVVVPAQEVLTVPLEDQVTRVRLRSLRGDGLVLHRQPATAAAPSRLWVLVAGAAADRIPTVERRAADTLGRAIGAHGLGLITGAYVGIDQLAAQAFLSVAPVGQLVSIVRKGRTPSVSAGIVRLVASDLDEYWEAVVRADGVVVLSDTAGTREVARVATLAGRPVFAYPGTPAANLPGVAPIPKNVAIHAGIAAEGILRSISQRHATLSPLSRWAGPALLAAAIDCLRVNPNQAASQVDRLWDAVLKRGAPDDAILDDTIERYPAPERMLYYMLLQHRLIRRATAERDARWFEPLVNAIVEETAFAGEFQEARLLWQGLLALHDHLGHSPAETLRVDLELRLQAVEDRFRQIPSGEPRDTCERLFADILARFADNPLRNLAGRYEHIRATEPSNDDRVSALDSLMLDARRTAAELGVRDVHITGMYKSGRAGLRVVALACCAALPDQAPHDVILGALADPATPFELWTAVNAAAAVLAIEPPGTTEPIAAALLALQGPSNNPPRARRDESTLRYAFVALAHYTGQIGLPDDTDFAALRLWLAADARPRWNRGTVVVIGSSTIPDDVPFCEALGARLAAHGWRLVSGRGFNVGPYVVAGYRRVGGPGVSIYSTSSLDGDPPETRVFHRLEDARAQMVAAADCGIVIRGGDGTRIECDLALAKPMPLLALPFTGGTAARIADTTRGHLADLGLPPQILGLLERDDRLPVDEQAERTVRVLDIVLRRWSERPAPPIPSPNPLARPRPRGHHAAGGARSTRAEGPQWDAESRLTEILISEPNAVVARLDILLEKKNPKNKSSQQLIARVAAKIAALGEGVHAADTFTFACYQALADVPKHGSDRPGAKRILQALLAGWLPNRYGRLLSSEVVERSSASDACPDLRLGTSYHEIAEARIAHEDGRPAGYATFEGSGAFRPRNAIPISDALLSVIRPANEAAAAIAQAIAQAIAWQLPNPIGTDPKTIRKWLAFVRMPGERRSPRHVAITSELRARLGEEALMALKRYYPALRLVELGQVPSREESRIRLCLLAIFEDDEPVKDGHEDRRS